MGTIHETVTILCPIAQGRRLLDEYFRDHMQAHGAQDGSPSIRLDLRVPLLGSVAADAAIAVCEVIVTLTAKDAEGFVHSCIGVHWTPVGGPYPDFEGDLCIESAEDYNSFRLSLSGTYIPPAHTLGKAFDAILGHHVASATARDLLARILEVIEKGHVRIEAMKPQRLPAETGEVQLSPLPAALSIPQQSG